VGETIPEKVNIVLQVDPVHIGAEQGLAKDNDTFPKKETLSKCGPMKIMKLDWLWLEVQRRPTNSLHGEVDSHLNTVGDLDEGNTFIHPVALTVESHSPFNLT
jgi:hypothetical protein